MIKKCFAILMSLALLLGSVSVCFAATPDSADAEAERRNAAKERLKSEGAANADFSDYEVLIMLYEGYDIHDYTIDMFQKYGVIDIKYGEYSPVIVLYLDKHDKQNVLDVAYQLYDDMPEVKIAQPNFYYHFDDPIVPDDSPETTAPAEETTDQTKPTTAVVKPTGNAASTATPDSASKDSATDVTAVSQVKSDNGTVQTGGSAFSFIILSALIAAVAFAYFSYTKKQN